MRIGSTANTTFGMPAGITLPQFDGTGWAHWSGILEALLALHEAEDIFVLDTHPSGVNQDDWNSIQRRTKAYLRLYIKQDIYLLIADDTTLPTFKHKWDRLSATYGGTTGSTTIFNLWIQLTQARLDDSLPMAGQLAKLNEARVSLSNASMGVTDVQFCLILLNALPTSYEVVASTILASGTPSTLSHSEIIARITNEEGWRAANPSLNATRAAPIKTGKKKNHSSLTCHYCQKKGHIQPNCQKKKWDEAAGKKKEERSSGRGSKVANSHILVETSASITEVADNEITASLYATRSDRWMLDSGATHHITPHRSDFSSYTPQSGSVHLGDKSAQSQIGVGSVVVKSPQGCTITLSNVLHVPGVQTRFISIGALTGKGADVQFQKDGFEIILNGKAIAIGYLEGRLYWLNTSNVSLNSHIKSAPTLHTWHQRMGHMSHVALKTHGHKAVKGLDFDASTMAIPNTCHGCEAGKSTRKPFPGSLKTTSRILEVVHSDLARPMQVKSIQGSLYMATFVDDYSHHAVVYCLQSKDQFVAALQKFLSWAETQTSEKLRALHSDRGGEYMAASVKDILNQRGIEHHLTMPGTPQQNGKAERFNHTIMDKAMSMLYTAGLSNGFWELAISSAVHIYNRTPTRSLKWRTPHEAWNAGHVPDVSYF